MSNYQPFGIDNAPPDTGILVFHVDESSLSGNSVRGAPGLTTCWPWDGTHYAVAILAADGDYNLERNVGEYGHADTCYISNGVKTISDTTVPNTRQYHHGFGVKKTGITITVNSASGSCMNVRVCACLIFW